MSCGQELCACREGEKLIIDYAMWTAVVCMSRGGEPYHRMRAMDGSCVQVECELWTGIVYMERGG